MYRKSPGIRATYVTETRGPTRIYQLEPDGSETLVREEEPDHAQAHKVARGAHERAGQSREDR